MYISMRYLAVVGALVLVYLLWRTLRRSSREGQKVGGALPAPHGEQNAIGALPAPHVSRSPDPVAMAEITRLVQAGRKIEAIKRYRECCDCGLREAKEAIDAMGDGRNVALTHTEVGAATPDTLTGVIATLAAQIAAMKAANQDPQTIRALEEAVQKLQSAGVAQGEVSFTDRAERCRTEPASGAEDKER